MIVKMKTVSCLVAKKDSEKLLKALAREGCVHLHNTDTYSQTELYKEYVTSAHPAADTGEVNHLHGALLNLAKYAEVKKRGMLDPLPMMDEVQFEDDADYEKAVKVADTINELAADITAADNTVLRLQTSKAAIAPLEQVDIPLDSQGGRFYAVGFCAAPPGVTAQEFADAAEKPVEIISGEAQAEQQYFAYICLKGDEQEVLSGMKSLGAAKQIYKDLSGTAKENLAMIDAEIASVEKQREAAVKAIGGYADSKLSIETAHDLASTRLHRDNVLHSQAETKTVVMLSGYTPENCVDGVKKLLDNHCCCYEFGEVADGDDEVPVLLKNNKLVQPFEMVTALYALPVYKSPIDPNPFIAPFFFIYFGLMMGDVAYGIIIALVSYFIMRKSRPREGTMKKLLGVGILGGISTAIWGVLFGSIFGNFIPTVTEMFTGTAIVPPPLMFDPLANPLGLFGLSLAFGVVQIVLGMILSMYQKCKFGKPIDAVLDEGLWLLIFIGLGVVGIELMLGVTMPIANLGLYIALAGAVLILLTKGRNEKGLKKITAGLGELYGVTGYLADVLSYSRLLALGLATAVIAQVMNTMGTLAGATIPGIILLVVVFVIGHVFNVAINILGTFVHTSRLQFIEFFGKFYMPGGKPFKPFNNHTKYVEVLKK